jgi:hypothetical protein
LANVGNGVIGMTLTTSDRGFFGFGIQTAYQQLLRADFRMLSHAYSKLLLNLERKTHLQF